MTSSGIWVDSDFGFDDLWALLLLRQLNVDVAGISLVHGNTPLDQVCRNAAGAAAAFDLPWPVYIGAATPMQCAPQTAQHVLGRCGMRTRGRSLPRAQLQAGAHSASTAIAGWLQGPGRRRVLALGPLTNIARFCRQPDANKIDRIIWMGGSAGAGNHTHWAEFNAACDPHALATLLTSGIPLDVVDLELCRKVQFSQLPPCSRNQKGASAQALLYDLLGGYLDIALQRGRTAMNIYDPIAALALAGEAAIDYQPVDVTVELERERAGCTRFIANPASSIRLARDIDRDRARDLCLRAMQLQPHANGESE